MAGSNPAVRLTEMTLMSSSWPKRCAAAATSAALFAQRASSCTRSNPKSRPSASVSSTLPSHSNISLSPTPNRRMRIGRNNVTAYVPLRMILGLNRQTPNWRKLFVNQTPLHLLRLFPIQSHLPLAAHRLEHPEKHKQTNSPRHQQIGNFYE